MRRNVGKLSVQASVSNNVGSIKLNLAVKSESYPLVIPVLDLGTNLDIAITAIADVPGIILISPPEVVVENPIYIGCVTAPSSFEDAEAAAEKTSHLHCLVHCNQQLKRFAFLQDTSCYCQSDDAFARLFADSSLVSDSKCNISCTSDVTRYCGGANYFSIYVTGK